MAAEEASPLEPARSMRLRICGLREVLPRCWMLDQAVTMMWLCRKALTEIIRAGVALSRNCCRFFDDIAQLNAERVDQWWRRPTPFAATTWWLRTAVEMSTDPFVRARVERGKDILAAGYTTKAMHERAALVRAIDDRLADLDALVMPTCPIVAPTIAECANPENELRLNLLVLRNAAMRQDFFDLFRFACRCRVAMDCLCLMLVAREEQPGRGSRLLRIAAAIERLLADAQAAPPNP